MANPKSYADRLAEIDARWLLVSPAPWHAFTPEGCAPQVVSVGRLEAKAPLVGAFERAEDAIAVCHAPTDIAWLVAQLRQARRVV